METISNEIYTNKIDSLLLNLLKHKLSQKYSYILVVVVICGKILSVIKNKKHCVYDQINSVNRISSIKKKTTNLKENFLIS